MRWSVLALVAGCGGPVVLWTGFEDALSEGGSCGTDAYVALDAPNTVRVQTELPSLAGSFPLGPDQQGYFRVFTGHRLISKGDAVCADALDDPRPRIDYVYDAIGGAAEIVGEEGSQVVAVQGLVLRADNTLLGDGEGRDDWKDLEEIRLQSFTFPSF